MASVVKARTDVAQEYPSLSYIWIPNKGNAAVVRRYRISIPLQSLGAGREHGLQQRVLCDVGPDLPANRHLVNALAAKALAAYMGYASTCGPSEC